MYFHEIFKFHPIFVKLTFLASPYFDHDTSMHHACFTCTGQWTPLNELRPDSQNRDLAGLLIIFIIF